MGGAGGRPHPTGLCGGAQPGARAPSPGRGLQKGGRPPPFLCSSLDHQAENLLGQNAEPKLRSRGQGRGLSYHAGVVWSGATLLPDPAGRVRAQGRGAVPTPTRGASGLRTEVERGAFSFVWAPPPLSAPALGWELLLSLGSRSHPSLERAEEGPGALGS